jgi:ABC-type nitrate/sulfonate/bicarbonate transport system ATPase subunit
VPAPLLRVALREKRHPAPGGGERVVLRDVRFTIAPGELVALLGPSGCGKTTLLHLIAGLDACFDGCIALAPPDARIGMVFQDPRLLPRRSVRDNLLLVLPRGTDPALADAALAEVGMAGAAGLWPRQLSLGMARRVALARALAIAPDMLVLDEPFASLDEATAAGLRALIARLRRDRPRLAALLVTHDPGEAAALADRALLLGGDGAAGATLMAEVVPPRPAAGAGIDEAAAALRVALAEAAAACAARRTPGGQAPDSGALGLRAPAEPVGLPSQRNVAR